MNKTSLGSTLKEIYTRFTTHMVTGPTASCTVFRSGGPGACAVRNGFGEPERQWDIPARRPRRCLRLTRLTATRHSLHLKPFV